MGIVGGGWGRKPLDFRGKVGLKKKEIYQIFV
jgi:hypothetical protein